jgi:hypothetical protein
MNIQLSGEQSAVIEYIQKNKSVIIDAVAGSGKTTTIIGLAKVLKNMYILQVTYNAHLKFEVKEKAYKQKVDNLEIHTYHSLCLKYYKCHKDEQIKNVLEYDVKPKKEIPQFSVIVIDEVQDMRNLYYNFILKFLNDLGKKIPIIVCGDRFQGIYEFSDADTRFLTIAENLYHTNFIRHNFKISYRVTPQIAQFLNTHIIGYDRIVSGSTNKKAETVKYIICNKKYAESIKFIVDEILKKLDQGYHPSDFFVLSYTVKHNDFLKQIENILSGRGICVYYENSDEEKTPDSKLIENKLVFTTIHCAKGRERKFVFFDGFDASFDYFCLKSKKNPKMCSSELYTALTRASQELFLIHDSSRPRIGCLTGFLNLGKKSYIQMIKLDKPKPIKKQIIVRNIFSVTDLVNHLGSTLLELQPYIDDLYEQTVKPQKMLSIKDSIEDPVKHITENVTDINGLVIPMIYECLHNNSFDGNNNCYILKKVKEEIYTITQDEKIINYVENMNFKNGTKIEDYITIGIYYQCICSGLIHKANQIFNKSWLNLDDVKECHKHLSKHLSGGTRWEMSLTNGGNISEEKKLPFSYSHPKFGNIDIYNRIDAIDDNNVWELKCVNNITLEHKLQLIIYYFIFKCTDIKVATDKEFKLLNMKSGELLNLVKDDTAIEYIMEKVFETKVMVKDKISDENFINLCQSSKFYHEMAKLDKHIETQEAVTEEQKLDRLDVAKLKEKAKKLSIPNYSKLTKKELIQKIVDKQKNFKKMTSFM